MEEEEEASEVAVVAEDMAVVEDTMMVAMGVEATEEEGEVVVMEEGDVEAEAMEVEVEAMEVEGDQEGTIAMEEITEQAVTGNDLLCSVILTTLLLPDRNSIY